MVPKDRAAEFFGFYSTSSRFAGIAGPLIFGVVSQFTGASRHGLIALTVFFIGGALLLMTVDEKEGRRVAIEADGDQA
jgi:UMF1 family MFS transporter